MLTFAQDADQWNPVQQVFTVWRLIQTARQILSGRMLITNGRTPIQALWHERSYEGGGFASSHKVTRWPLAQELGEPRLVLDFLVEDSQGQA